MSGRAIRDLMAGIPEKAGTKRVRLEHNTISYVHEDGTTRVRLHDTDIIIKSANGRFMTLQTCGWNTVTTRDRLSRYSGLRVYGVYGGRANSVNGVVFGNFIIVKNGTPVETAKTRADAEAARLEWMESKCDMRRAAADRRKERARFKHMVQLGPDWYRAYESELESRKESNHGV